jgi:hypothetical protein
MLELDVNSNLRSYSTDRNEKSGSGFLLFSLVADGCFSCSEVVGDSCGHKGDTMSHRDPNWFLAARNPRWIFAIWFVDGMLRILYSLVKVSIFRARGEKIVAIREMPRQYRL